MFGLVVVGRVVEVAGRPVVAVEGRAVLGLEVGLTCPVLVGLPEGRPPTRPSVAETGLASPTGRPVVEGPKLEEPTAVAVAL